MTTLPITPESSRLPRYTRADAEVSLQLTPRDLDILRTVESFRLLTSEQIQSLIAGSDQAILRRLQKLFHANYLDRIRPRWVDKGGSTKMVYAITNRGAQALLNAGVIDKLTKTDRNAQNRQVSDIFFRHTLFVSHIRAMFMLACQAGGGEQHHAIFPEQCQAQTESTTQVTTQPQIQFLSWREGQGIRDSIEVALPNGYARLPIAADGFFTLQGAKGRLNFLVEADRGTMSIKKRFILKLRAYGEYFRQEKHVEKFNIKKFRVLTVTTGEERRDNLARAAAAEEEIRRFAPLFLFAAEKDLPLSQPESVFTKIWKMPGKEELCSIL